MEDLMVKGFIFFNDDKIPFVIEQYQMELFTDDSILKNFCKEHNPKSNYILHGQCFEFNAESQNATFLVNHSIGNICYLQCYIVHALVRDINYDTLGIQSPFLDDIFKYKYEYLEKVRAGINLGVTTQDIYTVPFSMNTHQYTLSFRIGQNSKLGLLEDFDRKGECILPLHNHTIQECYNISVVLYRFAMFMTSHAEVPFKQITLYNKGRKMGWLYCPFLSKNPTSAYDIFFRELNVLKYVPKILNNIALDSGNKITQSIPLGHLGTLESMYSPQRFIEQITAFEYLFDKLDHEKAQSSKFSLKKELMYMFNKFPQLLASTRSSSDLVSEEIKELRRTIVHGYSYYYDFKNDHRKKYLIHLLDDLIKYMSLKWIGFSNEEIHNYNLL